MVGPDTRFRKWNAFGSGDVANCGMSDTADLSGNLSGIRIDFERSDDYRALVGGNKS